MSRFQAIGNYVYEKGERIGCTTEEAADALACKLNAYQMRIERIKAENARLRKAGDALHKSMLEVGPNEMAEEFDHDRWWASYKAWSAAKEGKPSV